MDTTQDNAEDPAGRAAPPPGDDLAAATYPNEPASSTPAPAVAPARAARTRALWRLLTLRRVEGPALPSGPATGIVGGLVGALLWIALDAPRSLPLQGFEPYAFMQLAWFALGALGIAALMNLGSRWRLGYARALNLVGVTAPVLAIAWLLWEDIAYGDDSREVGLLPFLGLCAPLAYCTLLWARGLTAQLGRSARFEVAAWPASAAMQNPTPIEPPALTPFAALLWALVGLAALGASSTALGAHAHFWYTVDPSTLEGADVRRDEEHWARANAVLFAQPARIDAALHKIPPALPGPPRAWFLGFAGDGDERVFAGEIALAQRVLERRFGTGPRSLALLNDRRDVDSAPLASTSALQYALQRLGERMNTDKDVLVLALSSHGGADATLSVRNGMLPFEDLSAADLALALAKSGIRWRVIIISACHAGAFIPALKHPQAIIITAAAPDRSSFGCADDRDLTYFGEAFYRDALPRAPSLRAAFDAARIALQRRELAEGFTPSQPTASFGPAMEAHVARVFVPVN